MTEAGSHIHRLIAHQGPLTVAQFMAAALADPRHGYYMADGEDDQFGRGGDFITAPEISQIFGELIGLWCADVWLGMGAPRSALLVELGPGRGTLMADMLRATRPITGFHDAIAVHLIEASPALRRRQQAALLSFADQVSCHWHDDLSDVPDGAMLLVGNEFFDALPIHQFVATPAGWRERMVTVDQRTGDLQFVVAPAPTPAVALVTQNANDVDPGTIREVSPMAITVMDQIARRLVTHGGGTLLIDYGGDDAGDSLQAVRRHKKVSVFDQPGRADLSAQVDFARLGEVAIGCGARVYGPATQGRFLGTLGIAQRAAQLAAKATPAQSDDLRQAVARLTAADQMGDRFKVLAATGPRQPVPDGFQTAAEAVS